MTKLTQEEKEIFVDLVSEEINNYISEVSGLINKSEEYVKNNPRASLKKVPEKGYSLDEDLPYLSRNKESCELGKVSDPTVRKYLKEGLDKDSINHRASVLRYLPRLRKKIQTKEKVVKQAKEETENIVSKIAESTGNSENYVKNNPLEPLDEVHREGRLGELPCLSFTKELVEFYDSSEGKVNIYLEEGLDEELKECRGSLLMSIRRKKSSQFAYMTNDKFIVYGKKYQGMSPLELKEENMAYYTELQHRNIEVDEICEREQRKRRDWIDMNDEDKKELIQEVANQK